jgi:hypothetical protein
MTGRTCTTPRSTSSITVRLTGLGILLGFGEVLLFGTVHALAIVPIWGRLIGGVPFAVVAALAVTGAFHTLVRSGRWPLTLGAGLRFGVLCWLAGLPATALVNAMRLAAAPAARPDWVDPASFIVAFMTGAALFWALGRRARAALTGGLASGVLLAMAGGAVPVVNSHRAAALWAGFLVIEACGGVLLTVGYRTLVLQRLPPAHVLNEPGEGHAA